MIMPFPGNDLPSPIRVAKSIHIQNTDLEQAAIDGINRVSDALTDAGYLVEEVEPFRLKEVCKLWLELAGAEIQAFTLPNIKPIISEGALKFLTNWVELYPSGHLGYMEGLAIRNEIAREWSLFQ